MNTTYDTCTVGEIHASAMRLPRREKERNPNTGHAAVLSRARHSTGTRARAQQEQKQHADAQTQRGAMRAIRGRARTSTAYETGKVKLIESISKEEPIARWVV